MATIVWVDDELESIQYELMFLESLGHKVIAARGIDEALKLGPILDSADLLIVDLLMPVGDYRDPYPFAGVNLIREVRRRCATPPRTVVSSAVNNSSLIRVCQDLGVLAILQKPLLGDELRSVVVRILGETIA